MIGDSAILFCVGHLRGTWESVRHIIGKPGTLTNVPRKTKWQNHQSFMARQKTRHFKRKISKQNRACCDEDVHIPSVYTVRPKDLRLKKLIRLPKLFFKPSQFIDGGL
jgi:hypothetical protein